MCCFFVEQNWCDQSTQRKNKLTCNSKAIKKSVDSINYGVKINKIVY